MKRAPASRAFLALFLAAGIAAPVWSVEKSATTIDDMAGIRTLDEVVVDGRLGSLAGVRQAIIEAQQRFIDRYNELNTRRELDVVCREAAPTGRRITARFCDPQKLEDITRVEFEQSMKADGNVRYQSPGELRRILTPEVRQNALALIEKDAELRLALLQHAKLAQIYEDLLKKKFADRHITWD